MLEGDVTQNPVEVLEQGQRTMGILGPSMEAKITIMEGLKTDPVTELRRLKGIARQVAGTKFVFDASEGLEAINAQLANLEVGDTFIVRSAEGNQVWEKTTGKPKRIR